MLRCNIDYLSSTTEVRHFQVRKCRADQGEVCQHLLSQVGWHAEMTVVCGAIGALSVLLQFKTQAGDSSFDLVWCCAANMIACRN